MKDITEAKGIEKPNNSVAACVRRYLDDGDGLLQVACGESEDYRT